MLKWILFVLLSINSFALEISIDSAKDNFIKYSTLNLKDVSPFTCQEIKNDFDVTTQIICAFSNKPSKNLQNLQNDFFKVNTKLKKSTYFLIIKPLFKIKLHANIFNLSEDDTLFNADVTSAKSWTVIGYKKEMPLIKKDKDKSETTIDFPFYLDKDKLPYVGSLDLRGNPVYIKKVEDITDYLNVKKYYKEKRYDACLDAIDDILESYPNTLFKEELLYYQIKTYDKLNDWDNVIDKAKLFLREYSASDNIAEVLSLVAKAYAKVSQTTDADYFFDRLFSEHPKSVYTQWGYIYKGDMFNDAGGIKAAEKFYIQALEETQDLEVAATAAFRLANAMLGISSKQAAKYVMKIVNAKPDYFIQNLKVSEKMMTAFADQGYYDTAAAMAGALLTSMDATYDEYEELLKDKAVWLVNTKDKKAAIMAVNDYIKKFPDGEYIDLIEKIKDELFFDLSDLNASTKLQEYDKLIEEYGSKTIGERALYEKAKLLLKSKKYSEVLALQNALEQLDSDKYSGTEQIIKDAAIANMKIALKKKDCKQVLAISNEYNITLSDKWDDGVYNCSMQGGDFELSKKIAAKNLKAKNIEDRKKWLYRYAKVEFATGNYTDVVDVSKDLITLMDNDKKSPYTDIYRTLFDSYQRLEKRDDMIATIVNIEKIFGVNYKDIDRYVAMIDVGDDMHDDSMIINYATKVMNIQESSKSYVQSPFVEFALYEAYMNKEDYSKAYDVIQSLDDRTLKASDRSRQKYLLGNVLSKLWQDSEAKKAYQKSIDADKNSPWAKLSQSALKI